MNDASTQTYFSALLIVDTNGDKKYINLNKGNIKSKL
jgi:hypothetical protein